MVAPEIRREPEIRRDTEAFDVNQKFDVELALKKCGFGPYNLFYIFAMSLAWCFAATLAFSDKFLQEPKQNLAPIFENYFPVPEDFRNVNYDIGIDAKYTAGRTAELLRTAMYVGWAVGSIIFGPIADKVGLKPVFFPALGLSVFFLFAGSVCPFSGTTALYFLLTCKFLIFVFVSCFMLSSYMWMDEVTPVANKPILNIVPEILFSVGQMTSGIVHQIFPYWRTYWRCLAFLGAMHLFGVCGSAQPPETLYKRGTVAELRGGRRESQAEKEKKAKDVLKEIRSCNQIVEFDGEEEETTGNQVGDGFSLKYFKKLAIMMIVWSAWAVGFWGIGNENLSGAGPYVDNVMSALFSIPGYYLGYVVTEHCKDWRWMLASLQVPGGILLFLCGIFHQYEWVAGQQLASFFANLFLSGASAVCYVVCPDMFKGTRTNTAMGILVMVVRLSALFSANAAQLGVGNTYFFDIPANLPLKYETNQDPEGAFKLDVMRPLVFSIPTVLATLLYYFLPSGCYVPKEKNESRQNNETTRRRFKFCPSCRCRFQLCSYFCSKPSLLLMTVGVLLSYFIYTTCALGSIVYVTANFGAKAKDEKTEHVRRHSGGGLQIGVVVGLTTCFLLVALAAKLGYGIWRRRKHTQQGDIEMVPVPAVNDDPLD